MWHIVEAVADSAVATWIRESPSIFAYTLVLAVHVMGLATVIGLSAAIALRLLGFASDVPLGALRRYFLLIYVGFWCNAVSGLGLLAAGATTMLASPVFYVKLGFIAIGVVVMRALRSRVFDAAVLAETGGSVPAIAPKLAVASLVCWAGALVAGRLTAYPELFGSSTPF
jgi:hypothetical protein